MLFARDCGKLDNNKNKIKNKKIKIKKRVNWYYSFMGKLVTKKCDLR